MLTLIKNLIQLDSQILIKMYLEKDFEGQGYYRFCVFSLKFIGKT